MNLFDFYERMPHIIDQILEQLDNKSLIYCKEVAKSWKEYIDVKNVSWIKIVKIPEILQNGNTYLHISASTGQLKMFEIFLKDEEIKDPKNSYQETPFLLACLNGHLNVAEIIMQKSAELNIDLNMKDYRGLTAFHLACKDEKLNVVDFLVQKSAEYNIALNTKHLYGWTAFHLACNYGYSKMIEILLEKSLEYGIDINAKDIFGRTAFHMACMNEKFLIVEMLIKKSVDYNIELNAKDRNGKTAFDFAHQDIKLWMEMLSHKFNVQIF